MSEQETQAVQEERIIVKTKFGDVDLGLKSDRELKDKDHADAISAKIREGATPADEMAKLSMQETGFDFIAVVENVLKLAGVEQERIDAFAQYPFVAVTRNKSTLSQVVAVNTFFHQELAPFTIQGFHARSVLQVQPDVTIWVRAFAEFSVPFIRDYKLPRLPGETLDLENAVKIYDNYVASVANAEAKEEQPVEEKQD